MKKDKKLVRLNSFVAFDPPILKDTEGNWWVRSNLEKRVEGVPHHDYVMLFRQGTFDVWAHAGGKN